MEEKWMWVFFAIAAICWAAINIFDTTDSVAQQIAACQSSCGIKGMNNYDAEKKICQCEK